MNLSADLLPATFYWLAHLLYLLLMLWAAYTAPWYKLRQRGNFNILLGASVLLLLIWNLKAGIHPGLSFHLLGATLFMLMFGWQFALFAISFILVWQTAFDIIEPFSFSLNALLMGALPSLLSYAIFRLSLRYLPHHFFIYTLFNGYFTSALVMAVTVLSASALLLCCGPYDWELLSNRYLPFIPMMVFAEGFFTGMLTTSLVAFRPEWIGSFNDERYLKGK
jgi:uncharacterized membrane protein